MPLLSVIVPVYNEEKTVEALLDTLLSTEIAPGVQLDVVVVDDGSRDGTPNVLEQYAQDPRIRVLRQLANRGKGAAVRRGFAEARGDIVVVQDADLEYSPRDLSKLIQPILEDRADVVFGSRFIGGDSHRVLYFWHSIGNRLLTLLSNMTTNLNLTDMECCYKMFRREVLDRIELREERFGFEPEITAKVSKLGVRIYEVGISYAGRTYEEGKKIGWKDGMRALWCILRYGLTRG